MQNLIFACLCVGMALSSYGQHTEHNLVFEPGQTTLSEAQQQTLDVLADGMVNGERLTVYPLLYDSAYYVYTYDKKSRQQAEAIASYCKTIGFVVDDIPLFFPSGYRGRSARVSMKFRVPENEIIHPLRRHFPQKESQFFVVDPTKDTVLVGNEGTAIYLPAGVLMTERLVQIELKEFYTLEDYVKNGLATSSEGRMIQTGGSIYLNGTEKNEPGKAVKIDPNKGVGLDFTLGKDDAAMEIFERDQDVARGINWVRPGTRERVTKSSRSTWQMTETTLDPNGNVVAERVFNSEAEWNAYQQKKKEEQARAAAERAAAKQAAAEQALNNEAAMGALQAYNWGYINCDRFPDEPMRQLALRGDEGHNAAYYLIFSDVRGVMTGEVKNGKVYFGSVPQNRSAVLLAVAFAGDVAYFYKKEIRIDAAKQPGIALARVDKEFVNKELAALE